MVLVLDNKLLEKYSKKPEKVLKKVRKAAIRNEELYIDTEVDHSSSKYQELLRRVDRESTSHPFKPLKNIKGDYGLIPLTYNMGGLILTYFFPIIGVAYLIGFNSLYFGFGTHKANKKESENRVLGTYFQNMKQFEKINTMFGYSNYISKKHII